MAIFIHDDGIVHDSAAGVSLCPGKGLQRADDNDGWVLTDFQNYPAQVVRNLRAEELPADAEVGEEFLTNDLAPGYETKIEDGKDWHRYTPPKA